ncbi:MAG: polyphosphate kinase 2 family protein [Bacteroidetes bacterium]|nr:polyphosphate kinase 2 family protein [Bacteroidota bacterium]
MNIKKFETDGNDKINIRKMDTDIDINTDNITGQTNEYIDKIIDLQSKLYADGKYAVLLIIQAMDTAGKDGIIKHVMSGLNPQATQVYSFKQPTLEELNHDFLWKAHKCSPERGHIGIFNRSYYEEVLVVRVHDLIKFQRIPNDLIHKDIFDERFKQIKEFEKMLCKNGTLIIKIFLHISKEEQRKRLLARIDDKAKNWKFSELDLKERGFWDEYMKYYEEMINETSTDKCPWYIVPSDQKKVSRLIVSKILVERMEKLNLEYPVLNEEQTKNLVKYKQQLKD